MGSRSWWRIDTRLMWGGIEDILLKWYMSSMFNLVGSFWIFFPRILLSMGSIVGSRHDFFSLWTFWGRVRWIKGTYLKVEAPNGSETKVLVNIGGRVKIRVSRFRNLSSTHFNMARGGLIGCLTYFRGPRVIYSKLFGSLHTNPVGWTLGRNGLC